MFYFYLGCLAFFFVCYASYLIRKRLKYACEYIYFYITLPFKLTAFICFLSLVCRVYLERKKELILLDDCNNVLWSGNSPALCPEPDCPATICQETCPNLPDKLTAIYIPMIIILFVACTGN